jgi:hypothetical protein
VRTTLTLDPDVERLVSDEVHRTRRPFKQVVNDAIRLGLRPRFADEPEERYQVKVHTTTLRAGIDHTSMNRLADELEDEELVEKRTRTEAAPHRESGPRTGGGRK